MAKKRYYFTPKARAKGLRTRRRNAKLRREGKLPPLQRKNKRVQANIGEVAAALAEASSKKESSKRAQPIPMRLAARLIVAVADAYSQSGRG